MQIAQYSGFIEEHQIELNKHERGYSLVTVGSTEFFSLGINKVYLILLVLYKMERYVIHCQ